jgi:hypothetical protein
MCGIAGFIELQSTRPGEELEALNRSMASTLSHRGPDDAGRWVDPDLGLALTHRRLSIIDLSPLGRQPQDGFYHAHCRVAFGSFEGLGGNPAVRAPVAAGRLFYPMPIRRKWQEHLAGKTWWHHHLRNVLMFQAWLESLR